MSCNDLDLSEFAYQFFDVVIFEEDPKKLCDFLKCDESKSALSLLTKVDNDIIDKLILDCHTKYCSETKSTPYEEIAPSFFEIKRECIKNASLGEIEEKLQHALYRIQYHFSDFLTLHKTLKQYLETQNRIQIDLEFEKIATKATDVTQNIENIAKTSVDSAILLFQNEVKKISRKARKATASEAAKLEARLSNKTAETSVTILGIFAGIVLTIVAGLFYSSSVIESINSASIPKLILVASLVGFICINIIAVMFHYIDRFRVNKTTDTKKLYTLKQVTSKDVAELGLTEDEKTNREDLQSLKKGKNSSGPKRSPKRVLSNKGFSYYFNAFKENHTFVFLLNFVLLIVLAVSIGLYVWFCKHPSSHENIIEQSNSNISVDVNISKGDATTTDSNTMDSFIDTAPSDNGSSDETIDSTLVDMVNTSLTDNISP